MLNELYQLSDVLKTINIERRDWHKDLKTLPKATIKKPCYKILIDKDISIESIEPIIEDKVKCLRKWEKSNGNSFPGFNIQPLYRIIDDRIKKIIKKWREGKETIDTGALEEWCNADNANWDKKFEKKMANCLISIPGELKEICADMPIEYNALIKLCERVEILGKGSAGIFFQKLESFIKDSFSQNNSSLLSLLIHEGSSKKKADKDRGGISIFMDIPDWKEYPVASKDTIDCVNSCLLNLNDKNNAVEEKSFKDAFGDESKGYKEKLPEVKLPVIGNVKLRAMTSESPCQRRYGTIDAKSFRIGANSRRLTKGALEWLGTDEREGVTWGRADSRELIYAYPTVLPESPLKLAACLGAHKADDTGARFENYAKDVIDCLKGVAPNLKVVELRIFSLRKMDKARTKVVFHRNYTAQRLADAAIEWQNGCANVPNIEFKAWCEEKGKTKIVSSETPFPLQIADCLNRVWRLDSNTKSGVTSELSVLIPKSTGIELLLDESTSNRHAPYLLNLALQNSRALFLAIGNTIHRSKVFMLNGYDNQKQFMPAILGLLLLKLSIRKENYMNNSSYLVGRMLKIADELHAVYCKEVRKNNLPPQLLGNALMVAALDSPTQALAQLALRIPPYLGWARTNSTASAGLSRFFLKEFGEIEEKLRDAKLPQRLDDTAKAQLLLGYISSNSQTETINN